LREYYGRKYEVVLEQLDDNHNNSGDDKIDGKECREKEYRIMVGAAEQFTEGFRTAAQNAVPLMCSEGSLAVLASYDYISVFRRADKRYDARYSINEDYT